MTFENTPLNSLWKGIKVLTVFASFFLGIVLGAVSFAFTYHRNYEMAGMLFLFASASACFSFILTKDIEKEEEAVRLTDEDTQTVFYFEN